MTAKKNINPYVGTLVAAAMGVVATAAATLIAAALGAKLAASPQGATYMAAFTLALGGTVSGVVGGKKVGFLHGLFAGGIFMAFFALLSLACGGASWVMPLCCVGGTALGAALSLNKPSAKKQRAAKLRSVKQKQGKRT